MWTNENRGRYDRSKLRYPSDLTDEEWALVEPLIPLARRGGYWPLRQLWTVRRAKTRRNSGEWIARPCVIGCIATTSRGWRAWPTGRDAMAHGRACRPADDGTRAACTDPDLGEEAWKALAAGSQNGPQPRLRTSPLP